MMTHKDKERDDALIAETNKNWQAAGVPLPYLDWFAREVLRLERSGWKPKPDRAEVLFDECGNWSKAEQLAIIRRHFDELRAEWEAERPAVVVPGAFSASRDGAKGGA